MQLNCIKGLKGCKEIATVILCSISSDCQELPWKFYPDIVSKQNINRV